MIHENFQCEFYFIRHGESLSNVTPGFAAGVNFDAPLTPTGVEQARVLGRRLRQEKVRFDRVYSSSLTRAIQTTEAMLGEMGEADRPFPKVDALIEQQMPGWRGVPVEEALTLETRAYMGLKGSHFVPPEGESLRMVQRRISGWLEDEIIYNKELVEKGQSLKIAVVGHGTANRCLFHYIMGFDERFIMRIGIANTSISRFIFNKEGWSVLCLNDDRHLKGAAQSEATP